MRVYITIILTCISIFSFGQKNFAISVNDTLKYQMEKISSEKCVFKIDLGSYNHGQKNMHYLFHITNKSDTPLFISDANWAEPMFAPTYNNQPIKKSEIGLLKYNCVTNTRIGCFEKTSTVQTNLEDFFIVFKGTGLPPEIFIDKPFTIDTIQLGDTIFSIFKIYNKSEAIFYDQSESIKLKIENIITEGKSGDCFVKEEFQKNENEIYPNDFKSFMVSYIPNSIGISKSKVILTINGFRVEHIIYATVLPRK